MKNQVFVANIGENVTEEQLRDLFSQHGEVSAVEFSVEEKTGQRTAVVTMAAEKFATKAMNELNGYDLEGRSLNISYADVDFRRPLLAKQRKLLENMAEALGEKDEVPLRQLEAIVLLCGASFAQAILKETEAVEAAGGLKTSDGERQRTKGGIFFFLARFRMTPAARIIVYNRKGRFPAQQEETPAAAEQQE